MRKQILVTFVIAFISVLVYAADEVQFSPAEFALVSMSKARMEAAARRDLVAWNRYVSNDCFFSSDDGVLLTKDEMLAHYRKLPAEYDRAIDPRDYRVHIYGKAAVINYLATTHEQFGNTDVVSRQRRTETFVKLEGRWLLVAIQWDNIPINYSTPVEADRETYAEYVGQYQWRPGDDVETVFLKEGRLWSQIAADVQEYLPSGDETFFVRNDLGTTSFVRDAAGLIVGYDYRRSDGQLVHVFKLR